MSAAGSANKQRMPEPGDVLLGRFRIEATIGKGGMGHVFRATSLANGGAVAIKVLLPEAATTQPDAIPRFINEARATQQLKSAHVVKLFDAGTLDDLGLPFIAMELLEGIDLGALIEQKKSIPVKEAIDYVIQACDAISEAHVRGIVHRDLKPSNLFLTNGASTQGVPMIKVLDFGISKVSTIGGPSGGIALTATNSFLGSPHYMPPEQLKSAKDVDSRADIWSLGVILYELIGGKPPFDGGAFGELFLKILSGEYQPLRVSKPAVPEGVDYIIGRCLKRNREERYPSLGDLVHALSPFATPEGTARAQKMARALGIAPPSSSNPIGVPNPPSSNPLKSTQLMDKAAHPYPHQNPNPNPNPNQHPSSSRLPAVKPPPPRQPAPGTLQGVAPPPPPLTQQQHRPGPPPPPAAASRESNPGFSSQPRIGTNAAEQHTIAASSHAQAQTFAAPSAARLPPSAPALPLTYDRGAANQAPQSDRVWNANPNPNASPAKRDAAATPTPLMLGIGIGLIAVALVGLVLIVIALRARNGSPKDPNAPPPQPQQHSSATSLTGGSADEGRDPSSIPASPPTSPTSDPQDPGSSASPAPHGNAAGANGTNAGTPAILNKRK